MQQTLKHICSWLVNRLSFRKPVKRAMWAGLFFATIAGGCGNDPAACDLCTIDVVKGDETWSFSFDATVSWPDGVLWTSSPIQFIVRGPSGDPVPGARMVFYTAGTSLAMVAPDRFTAYAVEDPYLTVEGWLTSAGLNLDYAFVNNLANPATLRRGIWDATTDDHGVVEVIPVGIRPGCPALPSGGTNLDYSGFLGVTGLVSDTNSTWSLEWKVTCVAPP